MVHKFGRDLEADIKELYGVDSDRLNKIRKEYFRELEDVRAKVRMLGSYIQNPVPCDKKQYIEFKRIKDEIFYELEELDDFVRKYHLREVG